VAPAGAPVRRWQYALPIEGGLQRAPTTVERDPHQLDLN
jgi:hypothetical protein